MSPCAYLLDEKLTSIERTWGGDVEIMAAACILQVDIFVATDNYRIGQGSLIRELRWGLLRANAKCDASIYITNYSNHYEPVISMINSPTLTYGTTSNDIINIE